MRINSKSRIANEMDLNNYDKPIRRTKRIFSFSYSNLIITILIFASNYTDLHLCQIKLNIHN